MKKWAILLIVVGLVVLVWYIAQRQTYTPPWAMPKYGEISRGDIRVPITASGLIRANRDIEVKPKASGEITAVPVIEGTYVHQGSQLVVLDPDDEQRTLDRVGAEHDRAQALLTQAQVAVERAKNNIESAKARLQELEAQGEITAYELQKVEALAEKGQQSPQELHDTRARHRMTLAQIESARIAVRAAELSQQDAEAAVKSQEATVRSARKSMEDAEERLRETTIIAPQDAIVTQVYVKPGMLVQSGTQSLTGGTPLIVLADVSVKKVIARLDEADYGRVLAISPISALPEMPQLREAAAEDADQLAERTGQVKITVDAFPDDVFEGRIERVEPQGKLASGSSVIQFDVHVEITDAQRHKLPLGAQAQVEFTVESATSVLRVPAEAVKTEDDLRGIYIKVPAQPGEQFGRKFVPCRFGISDGEYTQLIGPIGDTPLKEGTAIFTKLPQDVNAQ